MSTMSISIKTKNILLAVFYSAILALVAAAALSSLVACPASTKQGVPPASSTSSPSAAAPAAPSAPASDVVTSACTNLARIGCPEGKAPNCVATLNHAQTITDLKPSCLASAPSAAAAKACGTITCDLP